MQPREFAAGMIGLAALTFLLGMIGCAPDGAWEGALRLDPDKYPDPADRLKGVEMIKTWTLDGNELSGYQQLQEKGCKDPDSKVRAASVEGGSGP